MSVSWLRALGLIVISAWLAVGCSGGKKIEVGDPCTLNSDCNQGLVCTWGKCHQPCHTSVDCPAGQSCVQTNSGPICQLPARGQLHEHVVQRRFGVRERLALSEHLSVRHVLHRRASLRRRRLRRPWMILR